MNPIDLTGKTFGNLVVLRSAGTVRSPSGQSQVLWLTAIRRVGARWGCAIWECRCDCGSTVEVRSTSLRKGTTQSCGCLNIDRTIEANSREIVSYIGAHERVRRERGPARGHPCVDCAGPAVDWSYVGGDPDELLGNGRWRMKYSLSPAFYVARRRLCHARYDRAQRQEVEAS